MSRQTIRDTATGIVRDFRHVPLSTFESLAVALGVQAPTSTTDLDKVAFFRALHASMSDAGDWDFQRPAN